MHPLNPSRNVRSADEDAPLSVGCVRIESRATARHIEGHACPD
ncbi:hypothetical protein GZL_03962 [Streptomyces sp. 769]|nr:hypothetical protein GZL_03962 [Streptomyces sp. 769]